MIYSQNVRNWTLNYWPLIEDIEEKFLKPGDLKDSDPGNILGLWEPRSNFFVTGPRSNEYFMCHVALDPGDY